MVSTIGMNGAGPYANNLIKSFQVCVDGFKAVVPPHVTSSDAGYPNASVIGMTGNGIPTKFPDDTGMDMSLVQPASEGVAWRAGTYDVTFTPGLEWTFSGSGVATRTAYNSAAGTATIEWPTPSPTSLIRFVLTGYNGVARTLPAAEDFYFRAFKQGADTTKLVAQEYKDALAPFAGGFIRMMTTFKTNREAIANIAYGTVDTLYDNDSLTWTTFAIPPVEVLIEIATDCGMVPWLNLYDLYSDAAVTAIFTRALAAMPSGMPLGVEHSNECGWNFSAGFTQSISLNDRAIAAGVASSIQYAREAKAKLALGEAVFVGQTERLRLMVCWQGVASQATWNAMLNEGDLYQKTYGVAASIYVDDLGNYNTTTFFSKANRDLVLTDVDAFKDAFLDATEVAMESNLSLNLWRTRVLGLRDYCVSKGLASTAIRPVTYESGHTHTIESNTPTANNQQNLTRQALAEAHRMPRMGELATRQLAKLADVGADIVYFDFATPATAAQMVFGVWSVFDSVANTAQEPYASLAEYLTTPAVRPKSRLLTGVMN